MNQKGFSRDIVIVILALALGVAGYWYIAQKKSADYRTVPLTLPVSQDMEIGTNNETAELPVSQDEETGNWKTYRNEKYGFELRHQPSWRVTEQANGVIVMEGDGSYQLSIDYRNFYDPSLGRNWTPQELIDRGSGGVIKENIMVGDRKGFRVDSFLNHGMYPVFSAILQKTGEEKIFRMTLEGFDAREEFLNQVLATLKFTR